MIPAAKCGVLSTMKQHGFSPLGWIGFALALSACGPAEITDPKMMMMVDRETYPPGPYGLAEADIIENLSFKNPDDTDFFLNEIFADEKNKLLLVSTSSGWCTSCIEEQAKLEARHQSWGPKGLYILLTSFEDGQFRAATPDYAGEWKERYNLSYTVVADAPFVFQAYYDRTLTPMVMLIDVETMSILRIMTGFDESVVDAIIEAKLGG